MTSAGGSKAKPSGPGGAPPKLHTSIADAYEVVQELGCCVLEAALDRQERAAVLTRLRDQAAAENEHGLASRYLSFAHKSRVPDGPNQRVWNLISKGEEFRRLAMHPLATEITEHFLGPDRLLSNMSGNIAGPGCSALHLHHDQGYLIDRVHGVATVTVIWMLTDFTTANGATRVVEGSHRLGPGAAPPEGSDVVVEAPAGSALIMDGRTFHGTCLNISDSYRFGIVAHYVLPFIRQQENFAMSLDDATEKALSPELRRLLGFRVWKTLGAVATPQEEDLVQRQYPRIGTLASAAGRAGVQAAKATASRPARRDG